MCTVPRISSAVFAAPSFGRRLRLPSVVVDRYQRPIDSLTRSSSDSVRSVGWEGVRRLTPTRQKARLVCALGVSPPSYPGRKSFTENFNEIELVAPTGFEPVFESRSRFRQDSLRSTAPGEVRSTAGLEHGGGDRAPWTSMYTTSRKSFAASAASLRQHSAGRPAVRRGTEVMFLARTGR